MNNVNINQPSIPRVGNSPFATQYASALASGDPRYQIKNQNLDRPGVSRGRAQYNMAGIGAARDISSGIADAYNQQLQRRVTDETNALDNSAAQEQFAQSLGSLQQQNAYADQLAALQRRNTATGLLAGLLR